MKEKKTEAFSARIVPSLRDKVHEINRRHGTSDAAIAAMLLEAFCECVEKSGRVRAPYTLIEKGTECDMADLVSQTLSTIGKKATHQSVTAPKPTRSPDK